MTIKSTGVPGQLPRIFTCSDNIDRVDYIDIDFSAINLVNLPAVTAATDVNVNVHISDITTSTARIHFSQKFVGVVYYTVVGFN